MKKKQNKKKNKDIQNRMNKKANHLWTDKNVMTNRESRC